MAGVMSVSILTVRLGQLLNGNGIVLGRVQLNRNLRLKLSRHCEDVMVKWSLLPGHLFVSAMSHKTTSLAIIHKAGVNWMT